MENSALWLEARHGELTPGPAPMPRPGRGEIVVRARAVAVNPVDRLTRTIGEFVTPYLRYPAVPGCDVAGEVTAVGEGVTRFAPGDRVAGLAAGGDKTRNTPAEGAFQLFVVLLAHAATPLPSGMSFAEASVLPLAVSTAACGLFQRAMLALAPPRTDAPTKAETVLVWGGSTSVGANAIQLARAAGHRVVATASPRNFGFVKALGAEAAFDYRAPTVVRDLRAHLAGRPMAGALAVGQGSTRGCINVLGGCEGRRFVACASPAASFDEVPVGRGRMRKLVPAILGMMTGQAALALQARRLGVRTRFIWGSSLIGDEVGPMIFEHFLPAALERGGYVAAPPAEIVGDGLAAIPDALERQRRGVSATKLVVTL